jgi:hypothetical protein
VTSTEEGGGAEEVVHAQDQGVLRLRYEWGLSNHQIAASLQISHSTAGEYVRRASEAGLERPLDEGLDEARLKALLFPPPPPSGVPRTVPDCADLHRELRAQRCQQSSAARGGVPKVSSGPRRDCRRFSPLRNPSIGRAGSRESTQRRDLLEVLEDRYGQHAALVASQLPIDHGHDIVGDAILDRLVQHARCIHLDGVSLRRHAPESTT